VDVTHITRYTETGYHQQLTQAEVEWLRCLTISRKLTPVLPDEVHRKLADARLLEAKAGKTVITERGAALLRQGQQRGMA
jgi:hypothetical protein